jgi:hypothetical protein
MKAKTIAVSEETHRHVVELARATGSSQGAVVEEGIRLLERERFWQQWHKGWQELARDPKALAAYKAETTEFDALASDGLLGEDGEGGEGGDEDWSHLPEGDSQVDVA